MAWSLETLQTGSAIFLDCASTTGSINPAKLFTLARDMMQVDLAAQAMTGPAEQAGRSSG